MELIKHEAEENKYETPILFIHGMWHGAWCWDEFIPFFTKKGFTCYSFNLRNHGVGRRPPKMRWIGIKHYLEDLNEAIKQIGDPILIGHSMAGYLLQKYLENNEPPMAIMVAPTPHKGNLRATLRFAKKYPNLFLKINLTMSMHWLVKSKDIYEYLFLTPGTEVDKNFDQLGDEAYRAYMDTMLFRLPKTRKIIKNVKNPDNILLLAAGSDSFFSVKEQKNTAEKYGINLKVFDGLGHNMMMGPGSDQVAEYIIGFIEKKQT